MTLRISVDLDVDASDRDALADLFAHLHLQGVGEVLGPVMRQLAEAALAAREVPDAGSADAGGDLFLGDELAREAEQQGSEAEGAAGNDSGIHTPNVLRASGARKSAP